MKYLIFTLLASLTIALFAPACVAGQTTAPTRVVVQATTPAPQVAVVVATVQPTQAPTVVPTVVPTAQPTLAATPVATMQPTQAVAEPAPPEPPKRLILPGVKINPAVRPEIQDRWEALSYLFPDVAKRIKRIEVRRAGGKAWKVSYEQAIIYLNDDYGVYVQMDELTRQFARKAFAYLQRYQPKAAREYKTWQRLAVALAEKVR